MSCIPVLKLLDNSKVHPHVERCGIVFLRPQIAMKEKRTLWLLYIMAAYILFQLGWWGWLQISLTRELFEATGKQEAEFTPRLWMVVGEGFVFCVLLLIGFVYVKNTISRELRLARMEKTFLLSVTHELKTPIAAMRLMLDTLRRGKLQPADEAKLVLDALRECQRLELLSENILLATRLGENADGVFHERVDLAASARMCLQRMQQLFGKERDFELRTPESAWLQGDVQLLQALILNLLENAVKYSPAQAPVCVEVTSEKNRVTLNVSDRGAGIPDEEKKRVFEKFYRLGNEETRKHKGTGLGLYLVKSIARLHNASVRSTDREGGGSTFVVEFSL
jgi:signal transduction histidine kinase